MMIGPLQLFKGSAYVCLINSLMRESAAIRVIQRPAKLLRNSSGTLLCDALLHMKRYCDSTQLLSHAA